MSIEERDAAKAIRERPESSYVIDGQLMAALKWRDTLHALAMKFTDIDLRPLMIFAHGVERIGPDPVPENLRHLLTEANADVSRLQHALWESYNHDA